MCIETQALQGIAYFIPECVLSFFLYRNPVRPIFFQSWLRYTFYMGISRHMQSVYFLLYRSLYLRKVLKRNEGISDAQQTSLHESSLISSKTQLLFWESLNDRYEARVILSQIYYIYLEKGTKQNCS